MTVSLTYGMITAKLNGLALRQPESEYEAIASKVEDYIAMYADQELIENHGMKMGGM